MDDRDDIPGVYYMTFCKDLTDPNEPFCDLMRIEIGHVDIPPWVVPGSFTEEVLLDVPSTVLDQIKRLVGEQTSLGMRKASPHEDNDD